MSSINHKIYQKLFVLKSYKKLSQIENVLSYIAQNNKNLLQISILAKLIGDKTTTKNEREKLIVDIKKQLTTILGTEYQFGLFFNSEIGSLFIAGHLTPVFLNKVSNKEVASIPAGISALFRGLGISKKNINSYLPELKNNRYCLLIRGEQNILETIEPKLNLHK